MRNNSAIDLIFEQSKQGRRGVAFPVSDVPEQTLADLIPAEQLAAGVPKLPELTEPDVVRHFMNLAMLNMSVDTHFYPLGSCTMKYNPRRNETLIASSKLTGLHPYQPESTAQGQLQILFELQEMLAELSGLPGVSLQPAAGAHGELAALLVGVAYLKDRAKRENRPFERNIVLVSDGAHGTNPASAAYAGLKTVEVKSDAGGFVDLDDLKAKLNDQVAVFMITNPNTLGIFEKNIMTICDRVHEAGGLVYLDGANFNAIAGITRPGDFGVDMMHYNVHKTFSTPHGAGGPGAGPIAVSAALTEFLPAPRVTCCDDNANQNGKKRYSLQYVAPKSIGRVRSFFGTVGVLNRVYCYLRTLGAVGIKQMTENAVLNANYLLARVKNHIDVPCGDRCMHEFVASATKLKAEKDISAMDVAKRLLDYGCHAPTVYFPLIVKEALMIEPTETESKETLDRFADTLIEIINSDADTLHDAPHTTAVSRPDEVAAARKPVLKYAK
ncbi:MAG: aminomethyl-transferring glycine dehydrogenase subunit GcvPB [Planctomycetaceae bacterium]|nr:aminomethyl-transferring glycine dehydrogenase subunit GcvPB [Planctomycetaceae bacterium]